MNYNGTFRTNYFHVTDEAKYQKLLKHHKCEDFHDFSKEDGNGGTYHGFGGYCSFDWGIANEDGDYDSDLDKFFDAVKSLLPEGEAFILVVSGYEGLRYVDGCVTVVTKNGIESTWINNEIKRLSKELGVDDPVMPWY